MNERIRRFIENRWLDDQPAADDDIVDLWESALDSYDHARTAPPRYQFLAGYDAGRIAAQAIVRARNLRVRATNHHEMTIQAAAQLSVPELRTLLHTLDEMRKERSALEYGGVGRVSSERANAVIDLLRRLLPLAAENLREERPGLVTRIRFSA